MRMVAGLFAGVAATVAMTAAMRHCAKRLPARDRYPLPPREIVGGMAGEDKATARDAELASASLIGHFLYGGATGALFALQDRRDMSAGAVYGVGIWTASYLGWIPAARIMEPATRHPANRNFLMLTCHVVWGASLAVGLRELEQARKGVFRRGSNTLADVSHTSAGE